MVNHLFLRRHAVRTCRHRKHSTVQLAQAFPRLLYALNLYVHEVRLCVCYKLHPRLHGWVQRQAAEACPHPALAQRIAGGHGELCENLEGDEVR